MDTTNLISNFVMNNISSLYIIALDTVINRKKIEFINNLKKLYQALYINTRKYYYNS